MFIKRAWTGLPVLFVATLFTVGAGPAWSGPQDGTSFRQHRAHQPKTIEPPASSETAPKHCPMCDEAAKPKADDGNKKSCACCAGMAMSSQGSDSGKMSCCDGMKSGADKKGCCS